MRRKRALTFGVIRRAVRYVHEALDTEHPLATEQFKTNGVDLFIERLGSLINPSREGQLGMKAVLVGSLDRVEYDKKGRAVRLFPVLRRADAPKSIVIDPRRAFGRPVITGTAVPAADVRSRFDAGDGVEELARDFDVAPEFIEDALRATPQTAGWALWHVPLFLYRPGYVAMGAAGIFGWLFSLLTGAVLLTWLYNESRGSILVVALFHATVDVAFTSKASSPFIVNATGTLLTLFGIVVVLVAGPRYLSRKGMVVRSNEAGRVIDFVDRDGVVHPKSA